MCVTSTHALYTPGRDGVKENLTVLISVCTSSTVTSSPAHVPPQTQASPTKTSDAESGTGKPNGVLTINSEAIPTLASKAGTKRSQAVSPAWCAQYSIVTIMHASLSASRHASERQGEDRSSTAKAQPSVAKDTRATGSALTQIETPAAGISD
jgi:hypothetical protein